MLWFDTVCWCTQYGFLHISLKPHSSPVPWFPVSMEVWANYMPDIWKHEQQLLICTSWKHCAQARPMWTLSPETETVNDIFSLYMCREVISTYTCVDREKEKTSGVKPCGPVSIKYRLRCTAGRPVEATTTPLFSTTSNECNWAARGLILQPPDSNSLACSTGRIMGRLAHSLKPGRYQ